MRMTPELVDAGAGGSFFLHKGTKRSTQVVVSQHNLEAAQPESIFRLWLQDHNEKKSLPGGFFTGEDTALREWIRGKTKTWEEAVAADLLSAAPTSRKPPILASRSNLCKKNGNLSSE